MTELAVIEPTAISSSRAEEVRLRILNMKQKLMEEALELGRLLREARDGDYHHQWGYANWGAWVEEASGLDMSERSAYNLVKLVTRSEELGIPDEQLCKARMSSLNEIFALPPDLADDDTIRSLVLEAETMPLSRVRETVSEIRGESYVNRQFKFSKEDLEEFIEPAIERARSIYGDSVGPDGNAADISVGRALSLICADFLQGSVEEDEIPEEQAEMEEETEDSFVLEAAA